MPTENGCAAHKGRQPIADATCVTALRRAGAVIMGKTVTTELATFTPGKTHNPRNLEHTPGGSSSGSAAAVAAGMVPAALGTQTVGSVIRPAAYCGVYGFKPTFGLIPRPGVLTQAHSLDTVGVMGRSVEDLALVADALQGHDQRDPASLASSRPQLLKTATEDWPLEPLFAFVKTHAWKDADAATHEAFGELVEQLGRPHRGSHTRRNDGTRLRCQPARAEGRDGRALRLADGAGAAAPERWPEAADRGRQAHPRYRLPRRHARP